MRTDDAADRNTMIIHSMKAILEMKKRSRPLPGARVLAQLTQVESISQQGLADRMGIRLQSLVQTLAHLERSGYIRRADNPEDRREKLVSITPEGVHELETHESFTALCARILEPLTQEEKTVLANMLNRILEAERPEQCGQEAKEQQE